MDKKDLECHEVILAKLHPIQEDLIARPYYCERTKMGRIALTSCTCCPQCCTCGG